MALRSGLSLTCYNPTTGSPVVAEYAEQLVNLTFGSAAPGGCTTLSATLRLRDARLPRPELALFARVAVISGLDRVWVGEISEPALTIGQDPDGDYVAIAALGTGNALRDDPQTVVYTAQTVQAMAKNQLTRRGAYLPLDQDTSQIFPDNPSGTFNPPYNGRNMEEVIADLATLAAGGGGTLYDWGVWPHPTNSDASGFPTAQLVVAARDVQTTHYQASILTGEVIQASVTPSMERAYNVIQITYRDPASGAIVTTTWTDPRLNADGSQGSAPFRRRVYAQDLSGISTVTATQAASIAAIYGAQYSNITNKVSAQLVAARSGAGTPVELWTIWAGRNLYIPELTVRGTQLPTGPTATVNQFYIVTATYQESEGTSAQVNLDLDNFVDRASLQTARLALWAEGLQRANATTGTTQAAGAPEIGGCGLAQYASASAQTLSCWQPFRSTMTNVPTAITLSAPSSSGNTLGNAFAANITALGFRFNMGSNAAGQVFWWGTYTTQGNSLLDVDTTAGTFSHHCDACGALRTGLQLASDLRVDTTYGSDPGQVGLWVVCASCGATESFSTDLGADQEDEATHGHAYRALQAQQIRLAMRAHGLRRHGDPPVTPPVTPPASPPATTPPAGGSTPPVSANPVTPANPASAKSSAS